MGITALGMRRLYGLFSDQPIREQPIREQPIRELPIREQPIPEQPIREQPIRELPIREQPVSPAAMCTMVMERKLRLYRGPLPLRQPLRPPRQRLPLAQRLLLRLLRLLRLPTAESMDLPEP